MFRTRLVGAALLFLNVLPGCGLLCPDRPGIFGCKWRHQEPLYATPASMPGMDGGCGGMPIPPGGPIYGAPIMGGPVYPGIGGTLGETLPPPMADGAPPRIPKAGIKESPPGKQFELEGTTKGGPVLTIPANGSKGN
jgi:hypothetical protein